VKREMACFQFLRFKEIRALEWTRGFHLELGALPKDLHKLVCEIARETPPGVRSGLLMN
jgi:hypothetical protein